MVEETCWKTVIGDTFLMDVHVNTLTLQFYFITLFNPFFHQLNDVSMCGVS
jgi:hypothetical protein